VNPKRIEAAERLVAILLTAAVLFLMILRVTHAGALWRDEAAAVQLARMPTLHEVAANFQHEAFPLPFPLLLRLYTGFFGDNDVSLRWFGLLVGLAMLIVGWLNSRISGRAGPIVFLALFGLWNMFLIWVTSVRGYGMGSALILLTLGLAVRAILNPTRRNAILATLAAVGSVQLLLNTLPLIGAMAAAGFLVFVLERKFYEARLVCLCALIPALSFLPYLHSYLGADWTIVLKFPLSVSLLWERLQQALAGGNQVLAVLWQIAVGFLIVSAGYSLWKRSSENRGELRAVRFLLAFVFLAIPAYAGFLKILGYAPHPWYFLTLICALAGAVDIIAGLTSNIILVRLARIVIGVAFVFSLPLTIPPLREPFTNMDSIARKLEAEAASNDLIILNPWHLNPSFYRYYHGTTPWMTSPSISEHRIHRYDLMKAKMMEEDPLRDVRDAIRATVQSNHKVWIVGGARPREEGLPTTLGPPPHPQLGWAGYVSFWSIELGTFLSEHVAEGEIVIDKPQSNIKVEDVPLLVGRGWRD
jgi:hypothetical protein